MLKKLGMEKFEEGIPILDFAEQLKSRNLKHEYDILQDITLTEQHDKNIYLNNQVSKLNRWMDILPYKHSLVELQPEPTDTNKVEDCYINASYINSSISSREKAFIATQAPIS